MDGRKAQDKRVRSCEQLRSPCIYPTKMATTPLKSSSSAIFYTFVGWICQPESSKMEYQHHVTFSTEDLLAGRAHTASRSLNLVLKIWFYQLTPDKLAFNTFLRSVFDNPSWKGIWNWEAEQSQTPKYLFLLRGNGGRANNPAQESSITMPIFLQILLMFWQLFILRATDNGNCSM